MNLELAIVISCTENGCNVQLLDDDQIIQAHYSALVQNRIRIESNHLVAIDRTTEPPQIMWRWLRRPVIQSGDELAVTDGDDSHVITSDQLQGGAFAIKAGDEVWISSVDQPHHWEVHDTVVNGRPAHPDSICERFFPQIIAFYAEAAGE